MFLYSIECKTKIFFLLLLLGWRGSGHAYLSHGTVVHVVMGIAIAAQTHHMFSLSKTNARHNKI